MAGAQKLQHASRVEHRFGQLHRLDVRQTLEIDGHEQRGHLVVGEIAGGKCLNEAQNLARREGMAVALVRNQFYERFHRPKG